MRYKEGELKTYKTQEKSDSILSFFVGRVKVPIGPKGTETDIGVQRKSKPGNTLK